MSQSTRKRTFFDPTIENRPNDPAARIRESNIHDWRLEVPHDDNSDWSLHRSEASYSKEDVSEYLPGLPILNAYTRELSDIERDRFSYYPSSAKLIDEVKKDEYMNDRRRLARAIGWRIYQHFPVPDSHNIYLSS